MQQWVPEKSGELLENLIFQQCVGKGIEDWIGSTDGDTVGELLKRKMRFPSNTEMQVHERANTSTTEMPVSSGLKDQNYLENYTQY